jgi:hypothetical protein
MLEDIQSVVPRDLSYEKWLESYYQEPSDEEILRMEEECNHFESKNNFNLKDVPLSLDAKNRIVAYTYSIYPSV